MATLKKGGALLTAQDKVDFRVGIGFDGTRTDPIVQSANNVFDDFSLYPDGDLGFAQSGQTYLVWPNSGDMKPRIINGKMTFASAGPAGGYASVEMFSPIVNMGCRFTLGPWTTPNGAVAIIPWKNDIGASYDAGNGVPDTSAHLVITPVGWDWGVFLGGTFEIIKTGTFSPPLTADSSTIHEVQFWLDNEKQQAILSLPDGGIQVVSGDSRLGIKGYFACVEPFRFNANGTDSLPEFISWWAKSGDTGTLSEGYKFLEDYRKKQSAASQVNMADNSLTLTPPNQWIPGCDVFFHVPKSKRVLVTMSAFVDVTTPGLIFFNFGSGATTLAIFSVPDSGNVTIQRIVDLNAFDDGAFIRFQFGASAATGAASIKLDQTGANRYEACMSIAPL